MRRKRRFLFFAGALLSLCILLSTGHTTPAAAGAAQAGTAPKAINILFMGRDRAAGLADSMMLVSADPATGQVHVLQIPRDTYAEYTQKDYKKINGILNEMGEEGSVAFLSQALGVSLDHFAVLDLDALGGLVDAIGGVEVDIERDMTYSDPSGGLDISLKAGRHLLKGQEAENFIRYRSGYPNGDLGRLDAQKQFIRGFVERLHGLNPIQRSKMGIILLRAFSTDVDPATAWQLMQLFKRTDSDRLFVETLCGAPALGNSGASYYVLNREGTHEQINAHLCPHNPIEEQSFDPAGLFDREDHTDFHRIYTVPREELDGA